MTDTFQTFITLPTLLFSDAGVPLKSSYFITLTPLHAHTLSPSRCICCMVLHRQVLWMYLILKRLSNIESTKDDN